MWTIGSDKLDPTAGGGVRCTFYKTGGNIIVCGFLWVFQMFLFKSPALAFGSVPKADFDFCKVCKGFYRPKGFREGFYQCRGDFEGKLTCSKGERGGIGSPKWPDAIMVPF